MKVKDLKDAAETLLDEADGFYDDREISMAGKLEIFLEAKKISNMAYNELHGPICQLAERIHTGIFGHGLPEKPDRIVINSEEIRLEREECNRYKEYEFEFPTNLLTANEVGIVTYIATEKAKEDKLKREVRLREVNDKIAEYERWKAWYEKEKAELEAE